MTVLNLKWIDDMKFKVVLLALATLHFFTAFMVEVGEGTCTRVFGWALSAEHCANRVPGTPDQPPSLFPDRSGSRAAELCPETAPQEGFQEALQEAQERTLPAAGAVATPQRVSLGHGQDLRCLQMTLGAFPGLGKCLQTPLAGSITLEGLPTLYLFPEAATLPVAAPQPPPWKTLESGTLWYWCLNAPFLGKLGGPPCSP